MKIANWNVERLKHKTKLAEIIKILTDVNADILVLTETDQQINLPNYEYCISTPKLTEIQPGYYSETENRISIYTNYEVLNQYETYDKYTSLCIELKTEFGNLKIYGTIIGIFGNRNDNFKIDLPKQIADFEKLSTSENFCIAGDFNISFTDNYYFTNFGKTELDNAFDKNQLTLLTRAVKECVDHIAMSKKFAQRFTTEISEWNEDKKLSDHKGVCVDLSIEDEK